MIEVKFSELKVGDEFKYDKKKWKKIAGTNWSPFINAERIIKNGTEWTMLSDDALVKPLVSKSKFKDRYDKNLSIGDRILFAYDVSEELFAKLVCIYIAKIEIDERENRYNVICRDTQKEYLYISPSDIVKIEKDWGI
jgi:hypothetical protein